MLGRPRCPGARWRTQYFFLHVRFASLASKTAEDTQISVPPCRALPSTCSSPGRCLSRSSLCFSRCPADASRTQFGTSATRRRSRCPPPTRHVLGGQILNGHAAAAIEDIKERISSDAAEEYGCTLATDGASILRTPMINLLLIMVLWTNSSSSSSSNSSNNNNSPIAHSMGSASNSGSSSSSSSSDDELLGSLAAKKKRGNAAVSPGTPSGGSKKQTKKKKRRRKVADFPVIVSALKLQLRTNRNADISCGIAGAKRLGDLTTYAERWLAAKKKQQGHPLLPGTPMCDEVHSLLDLPPPPPHVAASASSS